MATPHVLYCDETHAPRQRCNRALAPAAPPEMQHAEPPASEPARHPERASEPVPSELTREAVAAGIMPSPSPYVTRAWEETARAVGPLPAPTRSTSPEPLPASRRRIPRPVVVIGALGVLIVLAVILRSPPEPSDIVAALEGLGPDGANTGNDGRRDEPVDDPNHIYLE